MPEGQNGGSEVGIQDDTEASLLQEIEELEKREEEINKKIRLERLKDQVERARERVRCLEEELKERPTSKTCDSSAESKGKRRLQSPEIEHNPTPHSVKKVRNGNTTPVALNISRGTPPIPGRLFPPRTSSSPSSSSQAQSGISFSPSKESGKIAAEEKLKSLRFYADLDQRGSSGAISLRDKDLDELRALAKDKEIVTPPGHIDYYIFLHTRAVEDLDRAIKQAVEQLPESDASLAYVPRLKDLIVMQLKKYNHTCSLEDLEQALNHAIAMNANFDKSHPDMSIQMIDMIKLMFAKASHTGSTDDMEEAMFTASGLGLEVVAIG